MRRPVLLITIALAAVLLSAGVALAASVRCDGGPCRGTNNADKMTGSLRNDRMSGLGSQDRMGGNRGNDVMFGGSGADTMGASYGNDRMFGGPGNDTMSGGPSSDRIVGGTGTDTIYGSTGNDYINAAGDGANDFVDRGTGDNDTVVVDVQEQNPANPADFIAGTTCENVVPRR